MEALTINKFLVKHIPTSTKQAVIFIQEKKILINTIPAVQKQLVFKKDTVTFDGILLQEAQPYFYFAYHKPRGMECTMDPEVENNLVHALPFSKHFFPIGRLDKESEGLLLLTNDGYFYREVAPPDTFKEKEYLVTVDKLITDEMINKLAEGVEIMGQKTRQAYVKKVDDFTFRIILTQGLNRQIRRMCYQLEYEVKRLIRIRIMNVELGDLKPGEFYEIKSEYLKIR